MSKKSKKNRNGNHNQNTPQPVRIQPEHQSQTEADPKPARGSFAHLRLPGRVRSRVQARLSGGPPAGPLVWLALVIGIILLVRLALVPRLVADGLAWAMAGAEEADKLLVRAWAAVSAKWKIAAASVMATSALFWAKVRVRMVAPVIEAEAAC